jgi:hypothetical protein
MSFNPNLPKAKSAFESNKWISDVIVSDVALLGRLRG